MYKVNEAEKEISFEISSEHKNVDRIVRETREYLTQHKLEVFSEFKIVLREMLINAIEHGNKNDCNKEVCIFADCEEQTISVEIRDEGDGFNLEEVADPTSPENIKMESGRGLHIIRSLSEQIECKKNSIQFKIECSE